MLHHKHPYLLLILLCSSHLLLIFSQETSFTFPVDGCEWAQEAPTLATAEDIVRNRVEIKGQFEDFSHREDSTAKFVQGGLPGFVLAIHLAFQQHYPLKLSVSDFIILIGQGLSKHINNNAEELRYEFVNHEGKETIEIRRDQFVMGAQNDWSTVFGEFADEIQKRVKTDIYDVVIDDTSVATKTSRIVSEITLMDAMQSYFEYVVSTLCGIPQITLEGTPEDWERFREKVHKLKELNSDDRLKLDWWLDHLIPIVDKICDSAVNREVDSEFWSGIYKYQNPGSGNPYISGWITTFFPYIVSGKNRFPDAILETNEIPKQVSEVPFTWNYYGDEFPMNFYGGFLGAQFNEEDFTVQPALFWSVNFKVAEEEGGEDR